MPTQNESTDTQTQAGKSAADPKSGAESRDDTAKPSNPPENHVDPRSGPVRPPL
jgi:hypothetical protein